MHLDDERVQRLLDGELSPAAERSAREHLVACAECRARAAEAEREETELAGLLHLLDHPAPALSAEAIAVAARRRAGPSVRWAAGLLLAAGLAGAAYATPGSPIPGWIARLAERTEGRRSPPGPAPAASQAEDPGVAGIAVPPGERLLLSFDSAQAEGEAAVRLLDEATEVTVRAPAGAATYLAGADRLTIANGVTRASYAIDVPRGAPRVEIQVAGTRVFLKEGASITARAGTDSATGVYRLPLTR